MEAADPGSGGSLNAPSASELARRIIDVLEARAIPHAVGGALALGVWGFPRATKDVDLDVFVEAKALTPVFDALESAGCSVERAVAAASAQERGDFQAWFGPVRIDVFVPSIPFYGQVQARIRRAKLEGRAAWFLAPEDLAVMKLLFFRAKDLIDVERLVASLGPTFDRDYVARALDEIVGPDDERVGRWRRLLGDVDAR